MSNFASAGELREISRIIEALDDLFGDLHEVSFFGDVVVYDSNGEHLGVVRYEDGNHRFYLGDND